MNVRTTLAIQSTEYVKIPEALIDVRAPAGSLRLTMTKTALVRLTFSLKKDLLIEIAIDHFYHSSTIRKY